VYREGNMRDGWTVRCVLTVVVVVVVVGGGEGSLTGVAKKSAVREPVWGFCSGSGFCGWIGDGGRVEKGEAKKAFVLDVAEDSEVEDVIISENAEDKEEALESDDLDRENWTGFSSVDAIIVVAPHKSLQVT